MAINFIKKEDLSHITRTTRQWETTIDRYEIIPKGVLCIELCNDKLTKIKIGNGHLIYEQLPYVSDVNLSDYYTKEETNTLLKNLKSIKIKGEASSLSDLPLRGNEEGDLWFVKKQDPETRNRYDEYVWYNNKWESFGSSDIDLSEYAKKSYVDTHIQEVQEEIIKIIESGYLHKHDNKNILDHTSAVYNVEKDNKLRDLHNYDDTELREKAHTHLNKNILDQTDAVYNRDKDDKLRGLHNYDDTDVKERIYTLESVAHSHDNQDVLNRTTAAFTKEQALTLLDCKDFKGTDGVHDGYHGFVPAPTKDDVGKVLGANGQWVEGGSSGGDTVTEGGGISITTDAQTGSKVISVNAGTGLEIDQQTGELYVTSTGGDTIAEGSGIDITTDAQTGVKTISVDIGDGLQFNQNSEIDIKTGDGLQINQNNELNVAISNGLQFDSNDAIEVNTGDGLSINQDNEIDVGISNGLQFDSNNEIEINTGDGLSINQDNELEVNTGNGLSINNNNAIELDKATTTTIGGIIVGDNLSIDNTGKLSADEYTPGEGISIDSNKEVSVKYNSDGLSINASDELELDKATKNSIGGVIVGDNINVSNGTISVPIATDSALGVVKPTDGLSIDNTGELYVNTGDGLSVNQDNKLEVSVGDGLSINASDEVELDKATTTDIGGVIVGDNIDVNNGTISVPKAASNKLGVVKPSDGLSVDPNGVLTVDTGDGLSIDSTTKEVNVNVGDGLVIDSNDNTLNVNIGSGLEIDSVTGAINVIGGGGNSGNYIEGEAIEFEEGASRLPTGYTELENISNVSASYIDTGYIPNTDTQLSIIANIHRGTTSWQTLFGTRDAVNPGGTEYAFFVRLNDNYNFYPRITGDQYTYMPSQTYDEKIRININNTTATVTRQDGSSYSYTQTGSLSNLSTTLAIFALHNQTGYVDNGIIDLYSFKIYENNTIVKDFVPCKRNSDDAVGLIDIINNVFYTNLGTGTFTAGRILTNTSINVKYGDGLSVNQDNELEVNVGNGLTIDANNNLKAKIGVGLHFNEENAIEADEIDIDTYEPGNGISFIRHYARELPAGYTQLEYIESHFDAGFILDYYPQKTSKIVCEAAYVDINRSNPSDNCLFGSRNGNSSSNKQFVLWFNDRRSSPFSVGFVYTGNSWGDIGDHPTNANMYQRLLFEISPSIGVYCNNVLIQNPLSHPDRDPSPYKLGILCLATSDTGIDTTRNYQSGRIFTFKIYESDTLVVDLVPCLNDSDVPGLYDMVNEVFYSSASGTDFTYDPDTVVTHDSITIDANRGPGIIYDNNALSLNPGAGLSIDETDNQKLNVNLADGLSIKNTSTNAIKINTGDGLSIDSTTNKLNVNVGDGLVKDSSNNIGVNLYANDFYIDSANNQIRINPLYAPTYEAGNGVQFISTSPYNLPPNYTKLSCVESKNTSSDKSAFRLNHVPTTETKFDVLFGITKASFSDVTIIGSGGSNTAKYSLNITRSTATTNNTTVRFNYCQDGTSASVSFTSAIGDILHIVADKNGVYVNNNLVQTPVQTGSPSSYKLCVGSSPATNSAGSFRDPSTPGKYYDIKIYEGNTLRVHLIPCLNDTNVPGMYDEVNEHFYHNEWKTDFHYDENEKTRPGYYVQAKLGNGLQFDANNAIEVVNGGTEYTAGDGIDINASDEISVKIGNHLSFDQTTGDINVDDIIEYYGGAATEVVNSAEFTIDKIRWTVSAIRSNSGSEIWIQLRYFGFYDEEYNRFQVSSGASTWSDGSTVEYYQNRTIESLIANTERLCAKTWNGVRTFAMTFNLTYDISSDDLKYFRYYTGDDESGRDPVSWTIEVHDKEADTWTQVQTVTGATVPTGRNQWTSYFNLNLPPSDGKKINVLVGDGLFIDSTNNDVNVKIGQALSINNSNEIDVNLGRALSINNNNEIDVNIATATSLGVVKAGSGLNIDEYGNLSTQAAPYRIGRALSLDDESVRLPAGYAKAKYVENPGGAGKRTGFRPSDYPNAKYAGSVSVESVGSSSTYPTRYVCGAAGWTGALKMPLDGISGGLPIKTFFYIGNGDNPQYTTTTFQLGERFDFEASPAGGFKINNELVQAVATPPSNFGTYYFTLFGSGASNGPGEPGFKGRMYYFRIYNTDDTLLANFVPAVRLGDNVVGFYNTVNNTFYSSETSTQFTTDMDDLDVDEPDWVLNADIATSNSLGVVKPSTGLVVNAQGALTLDKASASAIGGVKVGNNLSIDSNGVLSANIVNYSAGHAIEIVGDLSIDKFRWEITANAGDSMVAFRYFEYSDSDHIAFTVQSGTIEWSDGSTVSYPSGYDETFAGMMENRTKCTVTGWGGSKTLIMTFTLSQSILLSDIAYFRWKTDDYMSGRQPQEFNIYAHDSINDEWILLKEVTDHSLVPSSGNTWSTYIDIEPEIEPGAINVKYGNGLTVNQNNELEVVNSGTEYTAGDGIDIDVNNEISVVTGDGIVIDENGAVALEERPTEYRAGEAISIETVGGLQPTNYSNDDFVISIASVAYGSIVKSADNSSFTLTSSDNDCYTRGTSGQSNGSYPFNVKASTKYRFAWDSADPTVHGEVYVFENGLYDAMMHEIDQYDSSYLEFTTSANTTFIQARFGVMYAGDSITYSNVRLYEVIEDEDQYDEISVKYGNGLTVNERNELEVSYGNGLALVSNSQYRPEYYFSTQVQCKVHTDNYYLSSRSFDRTFQKTTTEPALCCLWEYGSDGYRWVCPLIVGTTSTSVQYTAIDLQQTVSDQNTFQYLGQTWYTSGYPISINDADHEDKLGNLQYLGAYTTSADQIQAAKDLIDLALINAGSLQAKLGDGLTFDQDDAITLDESIKLIIHCVGDPLT